MVELDQRLSAHTADLAVYVARAIRHPLMPDDVKAVLAGVSAILTRMAKRIESLEKDVNE